MCCQFLKLPVIFIAVYACPEYFRYFSEGQSVFEQITGLSNPKRRTELEVNLSQKGAIPVSNPSNLSLEEIQEGRIKRALYDKPELKSLIDAVTCSDQDYLSASTKIRPPHNHSMQKRSPITPFAVKEKRPLAEIFKRSPQLYSSNPFLSSRFRSNKPSSKPNDASTSKSAQNTNTFKFNPRNFFLQSRKSPSMGNSLNEICGRSTPIITPLIRGGETLHRGEFPWLTAVYGKKGPDFQFICGASLISARTVISAAHCFVESKLQENKILVLLGRHNIGVTEEEGGIQRHLSSLVLHPEYNPEALSDADVALLQLKNPVIFTKYISPICLWKTATDVGNIVGSKAYVAGWGTDEHGVPITDRPKKTETFIADDAACKRSLKDFQTMISLRTLCVSTKDNSGPCMGDSGGGLAMFQEGRWTLRAIVSAGLTQHGKCVPFDYYYFSDVAKHIGWIHRNMLQ